MKILLPLVAILTVGVMGALLDRNPVPFRSPDQQNPDNRRQHTSNSNRKPTDTEDIARPDKNVGAIKDHPKPEGENNDRGKEELKWTDIVQAGSAVAVTFLTVYLMYVSRRQLDYIKKSTDAASVATLTLVSRVRPFQGYRPGTRSRRTAWGLRCGGPGIP